MPTFPRFQPSKWKSLTRYSTTKSQSSWRYVYLRTSRKGDYPFDTCCVRFCFGWSLSIFLCVCTLVPFCVYAFVFVYRFPLNNRSCVLSHTFLLNSSYQARKIRPTCSRPRWQRLRTHRPPTRCHYQQRDKSLAIGPEAIPTRSVSTSEIRNTTGASNRKRREEDGRSLCAPV